MFSRRPKGATMYNQGKSGIASLLWMFFGAIVTLGVGVFMYKSGVFDLGVSQQKDAQQEIKTKVDLEKANKEEYAFYRVLPDQDSQEIPDSIVPEKPVKQQTKTDSQFKPDAVETKKKKETVEETTKKKQLTDEAKPFKPVVGDDEIAVEYEEGTYGDDEADTQTNAENAQATTQESQVRENSKAEEAQTSIDVNKNVETPKEITTLTIEESLSPIDNTTKPKSSKPKATTASAEAIEPVAMVKEPTEEEKISRPRKSYILKMNTYNSAEQADSRRAQVMMAGVDAYVVKSTNNGATIYQVVSNSMSSKETVLQSQQRLKNSGIDSLVIEQRMK